MITVSNRAGLHSQARDADDLSGDDLDKQWRKPRLNPILVEVLPKCNEAISRNPGCTGVAPLARRRFHVACRDRRLRTRARLKEGLRFND
jgi:hypothetical protein